jgi:hypothetical protein
MTLKDLLLSRHRWTDDETLYVAQPLRTLDPLRHLQCLAGELGPQGAIAKRIAPQDGGRRRYFPHQFFSWAFVPL